MAAPVSPTPPKPNPPSALVKQLCFWVLTAIVAGILTGWLWPSAGTTREPVGMAFVAAFTMLITRSPARCAARPSPGRK
ncbi:hypothetical protein [Streptomyces sp. NPDC014995]|uniref:hypothetical protein n=1 Tax=Streptomyces sp. NPDC014995 TaxID=3364936 RepID=UPI0036F6131B